MLEVLVVPKYAKLHRHHTVSYNAFTLIPHSERYYGSNR
jgi:hypothetical protein